MVVEKEVAPAMGSTGKSAAGVRVQFTTEANVRLSMYSLAVYREFEQKHGHRIGYQDIGYLLLVPHERWDRHLESVALQRSLGAPVDVLDTDGLAALPGLVDRGLLQQVGERLVLTDAARLLADAVVRELLS